MSATTPEWVLERARDEYRIATDSHTKHGVGALLVLTRALGCLDALSMVSADDSARDQMRQMRADLLRRQTAIQRAAAVGRHLHDMRQAAPFNPHAQFTVKDLSPALALALGIHPATELAIGDEVAAKKAAKKAADTEGAA